MRHGPDYRRETRELDAYRLKRRHGHYLGDQAVHQRRQRRLTPWIFMALIAVGGMVMTRNSSVMGLLRDLVIAARSEGCAIAQDLSQRRRGDPAYGGGGCER